MNKIKRINLEQYNELMTIFNNYLDYIRSTERYETLDEIIFNNHLFCLDTSFNNDGVADIYTTVDNEPIILKIELFGNYSKYSIESMYPDELFNFLYNQKHLLKHAPWYINVYTRLDYTEYKLINRMFHGRA